MLAAAAAITSASASMRRRRASRQKRDPPIFALRSAIEPAFRFITEETLATVVSFGFFATARAGAHPRGPDQLPPVKRTNSRQAGFGARALVNSPDCGHQMHWLAGEFASRHEYQSTVRIWSLRRWRAKYANDWRSRFACPLIPGLSEFLTPPEAQPISVIQRP